MDPKKFIIQTLSLIPDIELTPIQIQKLFFLIERRIAIRPHCSEAKVFNFKPYNYGPFDAELSQSINVLIAEKKIICNNRNRLDHYFLPSQNIEDTSNFLDEKSRKFIPELVQYIKGLTFKELCFAIYNEFPEMAENSILINK